MPTVESSLQTVADHDTEVRLFFTLPDGTLDRAELDRAEGLADVFLAVPAVEVVLFDTLTDMIASHNPMAKTARPSGCGSTSTTVCPRTGSVQA